MTAPLPARSERTPLRYRWSHRNPVHRAVVRTANRVLPEVPFAVKYGMTNAVRRRHLPYRLLRPGSVAVQVGAPRDTLRSGRSRAMAFALRTARGGATLVVEPDAESVEEFRRVARNRGLHHVQVVRAAAWSERVPLTLEVDPGHPATNFVAGTADYSDAEVRRFREVTVMGEPLDDLLETAGLDRVDLVSITTNGSEQDVVKGLSRTIERGLPYICLARTDGSHVDSMRALGYELIGNDDRGFTFRQGTP